MKEEWFIGQRVLVDGNKIAVLLEHKNKGTCLEEFIVRLPSGIEQFRRTIKPLPGGQL